jgi:ATP synthase protein I
MSQQDPPAAPQEDRPQGGDPWHAFGYVVSGVALYGVLGWLLDRWLGTEFLVAVGIVFGAALGIYLTFSRFNRPRQSDRQHDK